MNIVVQTDFNEHRLLRLLKWLAEVNAELLLADSTLPLLYDSPLIYQRERGERWVDVTHALAKGHEDCDSLAAYRAGELMARGADALFPGEPGYRTARRLGLTAIPAECMLTTDVPEGQSGLYHCITRYRIGRRWYQDDPSERLGMNGGRFDPAVLGRRSVNLRQRGR